MKYGLNFVDKRRNYFDKQGMDRRLRALKRAPDHLQFRFPCSLRDRVSNESAAPTKYFEFGGNCEYFTVK